MPKILHPLDRLTIAALCVAGMVLLLCVNGTPWVGVLLGFVYFVVQFIAINEINKEEQDGSSV